MTQQQHPITPPPELVDYWVGMLVLHSDEDVFSVIAQWGADQGLEATLSWLVLNGYGELCNKIRAARCPQPEPEGPTDEELLAAQDQAVASFPPTHPEAKQLSAVEYARELEVRKARAIIARFKASDFNDADGRYPNNLMDELSPAAQNIVNAAVESGGGYGRATPTLHARLAAALRAAADQVVPEHKPWLRTGGEPAARHKVRLELLAIAAELEGAGADPL